LLADLVAHECAKAWADSPSVEIEHFSQKEVNGQANMEGLPWLVWGKA
jgi:hypothetical protein